MSRAGSHAGEDQTGQKNRGGAGEQNKMHIHNEAVRESPFHIFYARGCDHPAQQAFIPGVSNRKQAAEYRQAADKGNAGAENGDRAETARSDMCEGIITGEERLPVDCDPADRGDAENQREPEIRNTPEHEQNKQPGSVPACSDLRVYFQRPVKAADPKDKDGGA